MWTNLCIIVYKVTGFILSITNFSELTSPAWSIHIFSILTMFLQPDWIWYSCTFSRPRCSSDIIVYYGILGCSIDHWPCLIQSNLFTQSDCPTSSRLAGNLYSLFCAPRISCWLVYVRSVARRKPMGHGSQITLRVTLLWRNWQLVRYILETWPPVQSSNYPIRLVRTTAGKPYQFLLWVTLSPCQLHRFASGRTIMNFAFYSLSTSFEELLGFCRGWHCLSLKNGIPALLTVILKIARWSSRDCPMKSNRTSI